MSNWLVDYPFADRLYPGALDAVKHVQQWGPAVILSDGDAVFQPRKVERSGLWRAVDNRVLIYIHKECELEYVERLYPANHYVLIDDKLHILAEVKKIWGERVTTVFPKQGQYAWLGTPAALTMLSVAAIAEILAYYIPVVDNLLDSLTTPAAFIAGTVISAAVMTDVPPMVKWTAAVIMNTVLAEQVAAIRHRINLACRKLA